MPSTCCAIGCSNRHVIGTKKKFFRFPKLDLERRKLWVKAIGRQTDWEPHEGTRICSDHFHCGEKSDNPESTSYIPSIFNNRKKKCSKKYVKSRKKHSEPLKSEDSPDSQQPDNMDTATSSVSSEMSGSTHSPTSSNVTVKVEPEPESDPLFIEPETLLHCDENETAEKTSCNCRKTNLGKKRKSVAEERPKRARKARLPTDYVQLDQMLFSDEEATDSAPEVQDIVRGSQTLINLKKSLLLKKTAEQSTQTILEHTYIRNLEEECYNLRTELSQVKSRYLFRDMELEMFKDNTEKIKYMTGLENYDMLKALNDIVSDHQRSLPRLSKFQQLMITLMKIKLNLPMKLFTVLFNLSNTCVSRVFNETVDLLFKTLVPLYIAWPNREVLRSVVPLELSDCQNCVYITDTFEMQIDLTTGANSSSSLDGDCDPDSYVGNISQNVRRYLMTIAPQGTVIFITKGVMGGVNDSTLVLESGFFENIQVGDVILTEKDLGIDDAVAVMGATLRSSNTVKNHGKSSRIEKNESNPLRLVRIKRVIQLLRKKYMILDNKIPTNWVKQLEKETHTTLDKIVQIVCCLSNMTNQIWTYEKFLPEKLQNVPS